MAFDLNLLRQSWPLFQEALGTTVLLFLAALTVGTVLGLVLALMRLSNIAPLVWVSATYVWIFRGVPALVVLFFAFYGLPAMGILLTPFAAAVVGLGLDAGAYKAEIIRAGIMSVDRGQWEAAHALAMSPAHCMRRIILPQAIRIMIPPYMSNAITLMKSTSLASVITVVEITAVANRLISSTFKPMEFLVEIALIYLAMGTLLAMLQQRLEVRFAIR